MIDTAYRLYAKSIKGRWILVGWHYQDKSWADDQVTLLTELGIETKIEEYLTEYASEG